MGKYLAVLKIGWQDALEYRTEFFISFIGWLVRLMISVFLFTAIFNESAEIGGFDLKETILYFIVLQILTTFVFSRVGFAVGREIQSGDLSNYLVKPISYLGFHTIKQMSRNILQVAMGLVLFITLLLIVDTGFFGRLTLPQVSLGVVAMFISYILNLVLVTIIGLSAFWITNSSRLIFMFYAILSIFSGLMIPLNFFPEAMQQVLFNTPFPYLFYIPAQLILGNINPETYAPLFLISAGYAVGGTLLMLGIFKLGIRKYEAVGR